MQNKPTGIVIGTKLWKCAPPYILEYNVVGIRTYNDGPQYELECQNCNHGDKCRVLVGGTKRLVFIDVLNDDEGEHSSWHSDTTNYWPSQRQAELERVAVYIRKAEEAVDSAKKRLQQENDRLSQLLDVRSLIEIELKQITEQVKE